MKALVVNLILISTIVGCSSILKDKELSKNANVQDFGTENTDSKSTNEIYGFSESGFVPRDLIPIDHAFFKIMYIPRLRQPAFVYYSLKGDDLRRKSFKRKDKFIVDPFLFEKQHPLVKPSEYLNSGYDKGHLAPFADFAWTKKGGELTFVMSNMVPQKPKLNRDAWKRLEDKVRKWACGEQHLTVITGPIFNKDDTHLKSGLQIPNQFFKIIVDESEPRKIVSFIYNQLDSGDLMLKRLVSLYEIEQKIDYQFGKIIKDYKAFNKTKRSNISLWKEDNCI